MWNGPCHPVKTTVQEGTRAFMDDRPKTMSVPEAGRVYFDLSKNASYAAVRRGDIPVIRIGKKLRVPICRLERKLEEGE
jgi:hypothetical protein